MHSDYSRRTILKFLGATGLGNVTSHGAEQNNFYISEGSKSYENLRALYNSDLSKKPKWIAPCQSVEDVQRAIEKARNEKLPISIKSGGHCFIGTSVGDEGMSINLRGLSNKVHHPKGQKFIVGPGAQLGEINNYLIPKGRLLPSGSCSGVGIGGLTLGGGYGFFSRQYGLTCDHLTRVKMVNGNAEIIDSNNDPDLLWACRGGGNGNFGVITSMEFDTRKAPSQMGTQRLTGRDLNKDQVLSRLKAWFEVTQKLPNPIFSAFVLNGRYLTVLQTSSYTTKGPAFRKATEAMLKAGYKTKGVLNSRLDIAMKRYYGNLTPLPFYNVSGGFHNSYDDLAHCIGEIIEKVLSTPGLIFQINTMGGAIKTAKDSAYAHREFNYLAEIQSYWQRPSQKEKLISEVEAIQELIQAKHHYRNYPDKRLQNWEQAYYGSKLDRLRDLKMRYDPDNNFRNLQSIST